MPIEGVLQANPAFAVQCADKILNALPEIMGVHVMVLNVKGKVMMGAARREVVAESEFKRVIQGACDFIKAKDLPKTLSDEERKSLIESGVEVNDGKGADMGGGGGGGIEGAAVEEYELIDPREEVTNPFDVKIEGKATVEPLKPSMRGREPHKK
jgi:hypothetical protein